MNITFRQLRVFEAVAERGSMNRAATALHLTPPAVSMHIKEIEAQVGLPLFERHGRRIALSTAGEYFLVHAKRLLANLKEADNAMARFRKLERGMLTIGMVSTAKYFLPHLLARFHDDHPGIEVRLRVANNREQLIELMKRGEADLSVMGRPPREMDTRAEVFAAHPLLFVCSPRHPLLGTGRLPVTALDRSWPLIAREQGSGTRAAMEKFFDEHRAGPRIIMEMPSNETIKQAVIAGLGLSFLSLHTLGLELRTGALSILPIEDTPVMKTWNIVSLSSKLLSPAAEAFRYFVLEQGEAFLQAHDAPLLEAGAKAETVAQ